MADQFAMTQSTVWRLRLPAIVAIATIAALTVTTPDVRAKLRIGCRSSVALRLPACGDHATSRREVTGKNGPPAPTGIVTILRLPHNGRDLIPNEAAGTWPTIVDSA